jgi:gamma-glutamyl-gamma-aminobutyrate hydrolase PuuD
VVPPSTEGIDETLDALDGIIFSGGSDLDPALYGAERHAETAGTSRERDRAERALMKAALERGVPILAICRGMQLLNVVRGGTLHQHLPDRGSDEAHRKTLGSFDRHDVKIDPRSRLGWVLGERASVPSHHHQAPDRLGRRLRSVASAPDGTIEAIEDPDEDFLFGVLWHPEEGEDAALFEALVERAAKYRASKS